MGGEHMELNNIEKQIQKYYAKCSLLGIKLLGLIHQGGMVAVEDGYEQTGKVFIPNFVIGICDFAFDGNTKIQKIELPESIIFIGSNAFIDCTNLREVILNNGLKTIKERAFECNKSLESIQIPDSVQELGENAFKECKHLKNVTIGKGIKSIKECTFSLCKKLEEVKIKGDIQTLESNAFENCTELKKISLKGTKFIGVGAFYNCAELKELDIKTTTIDIHPSAFSWCDRLDTITLDCDDVNFLNKADGISKIQRTLTIKTKKHLENKVYNLFKDLATEVIIESIEG